jgi:hypothetical protein
MVNSHYQRGPNGGLHYNYNHAPVHGLSPYEVVYHSLLNESLIICPAGKTHG